MQLRAFALALALFGATALRAPRGPLPNVTTSAEAAVGADVEASPTPEEVAALREKLTGLTMGLRSMLAGDGSPLANARVAPSLKVFLKELVIVLNTTATMNDTAKAMRKLEAAKEGVVGLTRELTARQEKLMLEDQAQRESLFLGVLMSKQHEPMEDQLKVLRAHDFAVLPVCKALLANHSDDVPLFAQAAAFLDKRQHGTPSKRETTPAQNATDERVSMAASLQARVDMLEKEFEVRQKHHLSKVGIIKGTMQKVKHSEMVAQDELAREQRIFQKWAAMRERDIKSMKAAVVAVKSGDKQAILSAKAALEGCVRAIKAQTGGFVHLLQLGHRLVSKDCPYCAAQCVDTCHEAGRSYTQCLGECAEAGKSK